MERDRTQENSKEIQSAQLKEYLRKVARWAPRVYFGGLIGKEQDLEEYDQLQPALCRKFTTVLNQTLDRGGQIIVIDFPFPIDQDTPRVQIVTRNTYLRQLDFPLPIVQAHQQEDYFSLKLTKVENPNITGGLSLQVLKNLRPFYTIRWNEEEAKFRRFTILAREDHNWRLLLDFNYEDKPSWKIAPEIFT